ncbi:fucolectin-4-like, partial [Saccostrea cucullata]|uniref:fucolectin-4-like n=1 Tax=Saccostrea cuccullata TaxID=36930 RepID=UPI002ED488DB
FTKVARAASASSVYGGTNHALWNAANAVDGIIECGKDSSAILAHTDYQKNPWLKVSLEKTNNVDRVLIYNRQDCCGERLHNVRVSVTDNGRNISCGFYPGPAANGDRILFLCEKETRGNEVTISILSKDGQLDFLNVCEVEIYSRT